MIYYNTHRVIIKIICWFWLSKGKNDYIIWQLISILALQWFNQWLMGWRYFMKLHSYRRCIVCVLCINRYHISHTLQQHRPQSCPYQTYFPSGQPASGYLMSSTRPDKVMTMWLGLRLHIAFYYLAKCPEIVRSILFSNIVFVKISKRVFIK